MIETELFNAVADARVLGIFKTFCENITSSESKRRLKNILSLSSKKEKTIGEIILREQKVELSNSESIRMLELINAFLNKNSFRKPIEKELKKKLLVAQDCRCAICKEYIDISSHADHIVPFKYVGDCLKDNWQLLCQQGKVRFLESR